VLRANFRGALHQCGRKPGVLVKRPPLRPEGGGETRRFLALKRPSGFGKLARCRLLQKVRRIISSLAQSMILAG